MFMYSEGFSRLESYYLKILKNKSNVKVVTCQTAVPFTLLPPNDFARELRWPLHPNLDTSSTFLFFVGV